MSAPGARQHYSRNANGNQLPPSSRSFPGGNGEGVLDSHSTHKETAELVAQVNEDALGSGKHIKLMGNLNSYSRRARRFLALRQRLRPSDYSGALFLSL